MPSNAMGRRARVSGWRLAVIEAQFWDPDVQNEDPGRNRFLEKYL